MMVLLVIIVMLAGGSSASMLNEGGASSSSAGTTDAKMVRDDWNTRSYSLAELSLRINRDRCLNCFSSWLLIRVMLLLTDWLVVYQHGCWCSYYRSTWCSHQQNVIVTAG
jgi:hypothetical protein